MGAGGTSGAVSFPEYVQDTHGFMLAHTATDGQGIYGNATTAADQHNKLGTSVASSLADALSINPYDGFVYSQPTTVLQPSDNQFDSFYNFATGVGTSSIEDLVSAAFDAVNVGGHTSDLQDISQISAFTGLSDISSLPTASQINLTFDTSALSTSLSVLTQAHSEVTNLVNDASTPNWTSSIQTAADKLRECDIVEEARYKAVIGEAATQAEYLLEDAIGVAQQIASQQEITDLVNDFSSRRETAHQRQVSQFNAQMADGNAVNSSAYMMGLALLKSEQQREESQFDKEITFEVFNNAISQYASAYAQNLQAATNMEVTNAQQYNQLLNNAVRAILEIKIQDWNRDEQLGETEVWQLFGNIFNAQLQAALATNELGLTEARTNVDVDRFNSQLKAREEEIGVEIEQFNKELQSREKELNLQVDQFNKQAREQRFTRAVQAALSLLTNRTEFEKMAADLKTEQKRIEFVARQETEGAELDRDVEEELYDLRLFEQGANILAAPGGMARKLPEKKSKVASALGGALQGAVAGGRSGGPIGAGLGAILGGAGGLL